MFPPKKRTGGEPPLLPFSQSPTKVFCPANGTRTCRRIHTREKLGTQAWQGRAGCISIAVLSPPTKERWDCLVARYGFCKLTAWA